MKQTRENTAEDDFSSPTPVKLKEPFRIKSKEDLAELPQKYQILRELFDRMTTSLKLLSLRKSTPTFQNISRQVEILTGRKFLFMHLAQIKYILPEAVRIDKTLIRDENTKSTKWKPELEISLLFDVIKDHHEVSTFVALRNLFSSRLRAFYITHPEGCDVPEAELPEPFNQRSIANVADSRDLSTLSETERLIATHLPPFGRQFSQMDVAAEMDKNNLLPIKSACEANAKIIGDIEKPQPHPSSASIATMCGSTPMKLLAESDSVLLETPVQSTPMRPISPTRSVLTCEDGSKVAIGQTCKQTTSTAKKSLDFYSMDGGDTIFSHKQASFCLSNTVFLIHQIFRSVNFRSMTKDELIHKIIMYSLEMESRSEVETQMEHVEKLVPDWFCKKLALSGDLYYVKKVSDLNSICERVTIK